MLAMFKARKYFWVVSLVTRALALTINVISVVWLDSHLPSASLDFYAANFVLSISQFRAVQFQFRSRGLGYFLSQCYYSRIMDGIASASYHVTMLRACALMSGFADVLLMPDCSVYFDFTTSVHNATRRAWMQICSATVSLSTGSNTVGDAFWSSLFCDDTVSCTSVIRLLPM